MLCVNLTSIDPDPSICYCLGWDVKLETSIIIFKNNLLKCQFDILSKKKKIIIKRSFYNNTYCNAPRLLSVAQHLVV